MTQDNVMKFFEAVRTDETTTERLRAVSENVDEFARLAADLGRERGFAFEPSDVQETLDALARQNAEELSDQELSAVAGGGGYFRPPTLIILSFGCLLSMACARTTAMACGMPPVSSGQGMC
jgi:predicted ribosomally synthesized peptide with nif11-like leader